MHERLARVSVTPGNLLEPKTPSGNLDFAGPLANISLLVLDTSCPILSSLWPLVVQNEYRVFVALLHYLNVVDSVRYIAG